MTMMAADPRQLRHRFEAQQISTASPEMCVVMLYDRLVDDLRCAEAHFQTDNFEPIFKVLFHAQEIVRLLRSAMRTDLWPEGANLITLYNWFEARISDACMFQQRASIQQCLPLVEQIAKAWRIAAERVIESKDVEDHARGYAFAETRSQIADFLA